MSARATIRTGDLNRILKAASAHGYMVVLPDGTRLLPAGQDAGVPSESAATPAQEALKRWRRSA
jgi:hypothetical protein